MSLNTPAWWYKKGAAGAPWWRPVLWPLSLVWRAVNDAKRAQATPYRSPLYVISVGNLTLGGSGKTPVTAEILRLLADDKAVGLSRGHGGTLAGPVRVDPAVHTAAQVGDEPLMLAQSVPFMVARDRAAGLQALEQGDDRVVVVDDAHQNLAIAKDVHVLVVDGDTRDNGWPFGDGGICPYGPMREPFIEGLARADVCVLWLPDAETIPDPQLLALLSPKTVYVARLKPGTIEAHTPVIGFAGIAKPWKFAATLKTQGLDVIDFKSFSDHAVLAESVLEDLNAQAQARGARLVTTEKDWIKLDSVWRQRIMCLPIVAQFDDANGFTRAVRANLSGR